MNASTKRSKNDCGPARSHDARVPFRLPFSFADPAFCLICVLLCGSAAAAAQEKPPATISAQVFLDKAQDHFFSLEFEDSIVLYKKALELEPENPDAWTSMGHAYLFQILLRTGQSDGQIFPASNAMMPAAPPDATLTKLMWDALGRARGICEQRIRDNARDAQAHYFLGLTYAFEANYQFNVAKRYLDALRAGDKAREEHTRVREIDPQNHDANLMIGTNEFAVGSVPASFRWMLYLAGYSGSKEKGVQLIQDALLNNKRGPGPALTVLFFVYNREKQYAYAREMAQYIVHFYPRNYFFQMKIGYTFDREGNPAAAVETYKDVAHKMETGAPGFSGVNAPRLYFEMAATLQRMGKGEEALACYEKVTGSGHAGSPAAGDSGAASGAGPSLLQGHALLRRGDLYRNLRQKEKAREMYERAKALPFPELQRLAAARIRGL